MSACPPTRQVCASGPARVLLVRLHGHVYQISRPGHLCDRRAGAGPACGPYAVWGGGAPGQRVARPRCFLAARVPVLHAICGGLSWPAGQGRRTGTKAHKRTVPTAAGTRRQGPPHTTLACPRTRPVRPDPRAAPRDLPGAGCYPKRGSSTPEAKDTPGPGLRRQCTNAWGAGGRQTARAGACRRL